MADILGPDTLRAQAKSLEVTARNALLAHAEAWETERSSQVAPAGQLDVERLASRKLAEKLEEARKQVEVLEQDRKWWQENAIKRRKRAATRRSELPRRP